MCRWATRLTSALARRASMGLSVTDVRRFEGNVRLRYPAPRPIVEDASVPAKRSLLVNAEAGYRVTPRARVVWTC